MKRILFYLWFISLLFFGCQRSIYKKIQISDNQIQLIENFIKAVNTHNRQLLLNCILPEYLKYEYQNDSELLFNDFFSGYDIKTNKFINPDFDKIKKIKLVGIEQISYYDEFANADQLFVVKFKIYYQKYVIKVEYTIEQGRESNKIGFVGAWG